MPVTTRFTTAFDLTHPVALAPMAGAAGGALAAAVARAGGLGLLGGGYGDPDWIAAEWDRAGDAPIGVGFITWRLTLAVLAAALARQPKALMLSFGDPTPFAAAIHDAGVPLICQCQTLDHAHAALDAGAGVIVAQGAEAGGHGATRGTMSLVPASSSLRPIYIASMDDAHAASTEQLSPPRSRRFATRPAATLSRNPGKVSSVHSGRRSPK